MVEISHCFTDGSRFSDRNSIYQCKRKFSDPEYQNMITSSKAEDIVYTAAVSGVHASFLRPSLESIGITEDLWKMSKKIDFGSELDAAQAEAKAWKTIWSAGQGVTSIKDVKSISNLTKQLKNEFLDALKSQEKNLKKYLKKQF